MSGTDTCDASHREDVCQKHGMATGELYSLKKNEALEIIKEYFRTSEDMG